MQYPIIGRLQLRLQKSYSLFLFFLPLITAIIALWLVTSSESAYAIGPKAASAKVVSAKAVRAHSEITDYIGPETCVACHETEAQQVHASVHYQQSGMTPNVTNIEGPAGKGNGAFNTYCGSIRTSPFFTCAGCHVGNGLPPTSEMTTEQLNNIDCLMCHQDDYARVGAPPYEDVVVTGADGTPTTISIPVEETFRFMPDESKMTISIVEAARTVHPTTRKTCLRCHAGASGSDGGKRGDMSTVTINPPRHSDIHMSPDGHDIVCADCHDAGNHRFDGRGLDLRPNDTANALNCTKCHNEAPHKQANLDQHTDHIACQTCHIPSYAKDISTEMVRDWTLPHFSEKACGGRGGWLPNEERESNVIPVYRWFDGTSKVYNLGQIPTENAAGEKEFGVPNGDVTAQASKIYPMKEHRSVSAQHDASGLMIPHSTFEFFTTSSFDQAVEEGMLREGLQGSYTLAPVHTYQTINHGVEDSSSALQCNECHDGLEGLSGVTRMDLQAELGYELKASRDQLCTECHEEKEPKSFEIIHNKHVKDKKIDCGLCHNFSRPERGLINTLSTFKE